MGGAIAYDVFLSYRREPSAEAARLLQLALEARGHRVFLDIKDLGAGYFDESLLRVIEQADHFVVLLAPGTLARCADRDDWLRREIEHALRLGRNVVPVLMEGFRFPPPAELPGAMAVLTRRNAVSYHHEYFDAVIERLVGFLAPSAPAAPAEPVRPVARAFVVFVSPRLLLPAPSAEPQDAARARRFEGFLRRHRGARVALLSTPPRARGSGVGGLLSAALRERLAGVTSDAFGRMGMHRSAEVYAFLEKHPDLPRCWLAVDQDASRYQPHEPVLVVNVERGFDDGAEQALEQLLAKVLARAAGDEVAVREHPLAVDCTAVHPDLFRVFTTWPDSFQLLIDDLWLDSLSRWVPALSYGRRWTLCRPGSDAPIAAAGSPDTRALEEVGIERGTVPRARLLGP